MTLPTGTKPISGSARPACETQGPPSSTSGQERRCAFGRSHGFTLIELILVMTMLVVVLSVAAPSLSRFFRGRSLDSEANRFLALTRYGQSRAVSEGVPVNLWIDPQAGAYGLQADSSYTDQDAKEVEYQVDKELQVQVEQSMMAQRLGAIWRGAPGSPPNRPRIRFTPDGFISESSPELIVFRQGTDGEVWIGPNRNRLSYEIYTNQVQQARR